MVKLAIHNSGNGFTPDWIDFCQQKNIPYKLVNCYSSDIIAEIADCTHLLWHHHHTSAKDVLFAKQLLYSVETAGKTVFPDFYSNWHFDDKVGQKYLLEAIGAPLAKSFVFYDRGEALAWARKTNYPTVFKLRGGAGSNNVRLVHDYSSAARLIKKSFSSGFENYNRWVDLKENWRRWRMGKNSLVNILKSIRRVFVSTAFARTTGRQKGYVYFQEFIPNNTFDIRIITIGNRAFAIKRLAREGDFRASGSGLIVHDPKQIPVKCVSIAFDVSRKLKATLVAYDFVLGPNETPLIVEINYGYAHKAYFDCPGYWDDSLNWHEMKFNSAHWIIEFLVSRDNFLDVYK